MNPPNKRTVRQQAEEQQHAQNDQQTRPAVTREFANVEAMLRHDAVHTPVPPAIAQRLKESIAQLPPQPRPTLWRRLFGGSGL